MSESPGFHERDFSAVSREYRQSLEGNGPHGVQLPRKKAPGENFTLIQVIIAVIVLHTEPENQTDPVPEAFSQGIIAQERRDSIAALLDGENQTVPNPVDAQKPVAWGNKKRFLVGQGPELLADGTAEKIIEAGIAQRQIIRHAYAVFFRKGPDQRP